MPAPAPVTKADFPAKRPTVVVELDMERSSCGCEQTARTLTQRVIFSIIGSDAGAIVGNERLGRHLGSCSTATLSEFVARTPWEALPESVRHEAKRSLLNYFAVALGGCRDPVVDSVSSVLDVACGVNATVIGRNEQRGAYDAAFLNAISANVFDFDDTHAPTIIHPTAPVAPPLFAYSEVAGLSGQDLLLAFALGVEVECRLGHSSFALALPTRLAHHVDVRSIWRSDGNGQSDWTRCRADGLGAGQRVRERSRADRNAGHDVEKPRSGWLGAERMAGRRLRACRCFRAGAPCWRARVDFYA